jgi:hypothetical protein
MRPDPVLAARQAMEREAAAGVPRDYAEAVERIRELEAEVERLQDLCVTQAERTDQ